MSTKVPHGHLGPYRLLKVVHSSQTAQVWQAYHDGLDRFFAVKALQNDCSKDREQANYLKREYEVGAKLDHPRVIRVQEFGNERGIPFLALEWFPAPNMKHRIHQGVEAIAHLVPKIVLQAGEALAYFHGQGWVHRDIKPENFLVDDQGEVKLLDFALAQRQRSGLAKLFIPKSKVQGTRSYMSPEQIRGAAVDQRSDLYSLACTFYELIAGKPPYTGATTNELLNKHLKANPPSLESVNKNVTPEFSELLRRALAKEPSDRPQTSQEFLRQLQAVRVFRRAPLPPTEGKTTGPAPTPGAPDKS